MRTIGDLMARSRMYASGKVKIERIMDAFSTAWLSCMDAIIDSNTGVLLCEGFSLQGYGMDAAQFESAIRIPKRLPMPDYILSHYKAAVIVIEDNMRLPLFIDMPAAYWERMIATFGKVNRVHSTPSVSFHDRFLEAMPGLQDNKADMFAEDMSDMFKDNLVRYMDTISIPTPAGEFTLTPDAPPRGLSGYDYQSDRNQHRGYYYFPIAYKDALDLKPGKKLRNVRLSTDRSRLIGKHKYAVKAYDDRFYGNIVWMDEYELGQYDVVKLGEYVKP